MPAVFAHRCTGCGACTAACPTEAVVMETPTDAELFRATAAAAVRTKRVVWICGNAGDSDLGGVDASSICRMPCLMRLSSDLVVEAAALGAEDIVLTTGGCSVCGREVPGRLEAVVSESRTVLGSFGRDLKVERRICRSRIDAGRRRFFSGLQKRFEQAERMAEVSAAGHPQAGGSLAAASANEPRQRVPEGRLRKISALMMLAQSAKLSAQPKPGNPITPLKLLRPVMNPETCVKCGLCAASCPTGALQVHRRMDAAGSETASFGLTPKNCIACGLCAEVCWKSALRLKAVPLGAALAAAEVELLRGEAAAAAHENDFESAVRAMTDVPIYRT